MAVFAVVVDLENFVDLVEAVVVVLAAFVVFGPAEAGLAVDFTFTGFTAAARDFGVVDFTLGPLATEGFVAREVTLGP